MSPAPPQTSVPAPTDAVPGSAISDALVAVRQLTVAYGGNTVLEEIDLDVAPGEIVTLIGPNGAGKSSLVKAVLGLVPPSRGTVWRRPGLRIGYMPQRLSVDPALPLTVARFLGLWGPVTADETAAALAEVGAPDVGRRPVQALSGGEMQRVLLARALLRRPDLLVLDEPVQAVDVHGQIALFQLIADLRARRGCAVLMVSHDLHLVMARTDRVLCIHRHVCCAGKPEEVSRHPEYARLFGRHAEALALYHHNHGHAHAPDGHVVPLAAPDVADDRAEDAARDGAQRGCRHG